MSYVALYRKFRPQTFAQIKGQDHVVRTLKNQLINQRIGHAYLFTGTRGTGKTSAAKLFAKAVNCEHPVNGEPCNECETCRAINAGNFVDVVEVDAASNNGVDDIRRIIEEVRYTPVKGSYKVFIIDEAHMITGPAFNAFLKTLEEPPAYAVFILATTEPHKLPITILSRCQRYDFRRISLENLAGNLKEIVEREGVEAEDKALSYIARMGDGSMRDSISLLDKCIAFNLGEKLSYERVLDTLGTVDTELFSRLFRAVYQGDVAAALEIIDDTVAKGRDLTQFTTDFIWYIRNLLMVKASGTEDPGVLGVSAENLAQMQRDANGAEIPVLMRYIRLLSELLNQIRFATSKQVLLEVGIIRMAKPEMETDTESLQDRIRHLEQSISSGLVQPAPQQSISYASPQPAAPAAVQSQPQVNKPQTEPSQEEPALAYAPAPDYEDDDDFFRGIGHMTNPDAFAGLFDDEPVMEMPQQRETAVKANPQNTPQQPRVAEAAPQSQGTSMSQDIAARWPKIVAACGNPMTRITLNKCTVRQTGESSIKILAPTDFQLKVLKDAQNFAQVQELLRSQTGREIDIQMALLGSEPKAAPAADQFPEELLKNINFNIGTEDF